MTDKKIIKTIFKRYEDIIFEILNIDRDEIKTINFELKKLYARIPITHKLYKYDIKSNTEIEAWKYNIKKMVLEKNPLKYLERYL